MALRRQVRPIFLSVPPHPPGRATGSDPTSGTLPEEEYVRERRRDYELMFIISPLAANEEGITSTIERIRQTIEANGGEVRSINHAPPWGRRKLAYPIREYVAGEASRRRFTEGYYVLMHFSISASKVIEVERTLKLTDTILRHLITVVERKGASAPALERIEEEAEVAEPVSEGDEE